jgi:hypothetical protein
MRELSKGSTLALAVNYMHSWRLEFSIFNSNYVAQASTRPTDQGTKVQGKSTQNRNPAFGVLARFSQSPVYTSSSIQICLPCSSRRYSRRRKERCTTCEDACRVPMCCTGQDAAVSNAPSMSDMVRAPEMRLLRIKFGHGNPPSVWLDLLQFLQMYPRALKRVVGAHPSDSSRG